MEARKPEPKTKPSPAPALHAKEPIALRQIALTEDEADLIIALRRQDETGIPLEEVLAEHGYKLDD